jgi:hypothetical protein
MHGRTACVVFEVESFSSVPRDVYRSSTEEQNMNAKYVQLALAVLLLAGTPTLAIGRLINLMTYEELLAESNVVVIVHSLSTRMANPTDSVVPLGKTHDSLEPVFTRFRTLATLKGDAAKEFELCHYRHKDSKNASAITNGPLLVGFPTHAKEGVEWSGEWMGPSNNDYILFLVRDDSGRLTFVNGQFDAQLSTRKLTSPPER